MGTGTHLYPKTLAETIGHKNLYNGNEVPGSFGKFWEVIELPWFLLILIGLFWKQAEIQNISL